MPDNHEAIKGHIYESRGSFNMPIPEDIGLGLIKDWRDELEAKEGIISNYIEVNGTDFVVQWKVTGTPEPGVVSTIVTAIIAIAVLVAAYYALSGLSAVIHETGELASVLGPENLSLLLNIVFFFFMLMMFSPMISMITELPKRLVRKE